MVVHLQELPAPHTLSYTSQYTPRSPPVQPQSEPLAEHWAAPLEQLGVQGFAQGAVMKHCFLLFPTQIHQVQTRQP